MKLIPKISEELRSIMSSDEQTAFTEYVDITEKKENKLEEAKKELADNTINKVEKVEKTEKIESEKESEPEKQTEPPKIVDKTFFGDKSF